MMPIDFNPISRAATAVAIIWLEKAPPKVITVSNSIFLASRRLYFNFLNLFPDTMGCNKSSRFTNNETLSIPKQEGSISIVGTRILSKKLGIRTKIVNGILLKSRCFLNLLLKHQTPPLQYIILRFNWNSEHYLHYFLTFLCKNLVFIKKLS